MLPATFITLGAFIALFLGERTFGDSGMTRWILDAAGLAALLTALVLRLREHQAAVGDYSRRARRVAFGFTLLALAGLLVYALGADLVVDKLGFEDQLAGRWQVVFGSLWPILLAAGLVPMVMVDRAVAASPAAPHPARVSHAIDSGLTAVLAIAILFPLNWLAHDLNHRWDLAYFKTTEPGTATAAIIDNMDEPMEVVLFFPASSDVGREVLPYFEALAGPNLSVSLVDHALEPVRAKDLKVRDNGHIAFVQGEHSETLKVGTDIDKARRTLKKLDSEVQKTLLAMAKGERIAYFTAGHGELDWRGSHGPDRKISLLKKLLEALNYKVETLSIGEGLATAVPDDASMVVVLGPTDPFLPAEVEALEAYRTSGGSLLLALEPTTQDDLDLGLDPLLTTLGVQFFPTTLAIDDANGFLPIHGGIIDRQNLGTNRYSSHESVTTLSKNRRAAWMVFPGTGWFEETEGHVGKVTATVRTQAQTWDDVDFDFEFDEDVEARKVRDVAMVASGPATGDAEYRAVLLGDAGFAADLLLPNKANAQFVIDATNWLLREEELSGTVNDEEDIKIVHSKEGQGILFYGTTFLVPLVLGIFGFVRVRIRRKSRKGVS
jgi:hypothetical protein